MNQPLRIGLIGAGMVSRHHLIAWAELSDQARVVAVADPSAENAARRATEFGISQIYANAGAMLAATELDAIDIAAPRQMHAPLVRLAAKKRLPVLCQKPLAPNLQEAIDLDAEVADLTRLMVHENWRFRGYYRDAAAWLREGRIGNVKQAQLPYIPDMEVPFEVVYVDVLDSLVAFTTGKFDSIYYVNAKTGNASYAMFDISNNDPILAFQDDPSTFADDTYNNAVYDPHSRHIYFQASVMDSDGMATTSLIRTSPFVAGPPQPLYWLNVADSPIDFGYQYMQRATCVGKCPT